MQKIVSVLRDHRTRPKAAKPGAGFRDGSTDISLVSGMVTVLAQEPSHSFRSLRQLSVSSMIVLKRHPTFSSFSADFFKARSMPGISLHSAISTVVG